MKTLRLSLKLYSTFHTDLLVLKDCDVAFSALVKLALYYRVRGRKLNIFVAECHAYRYRYRRAFTKDVIMIDDEVTIKFLTTMIREKRRMAFIRSVLYDALMSPPCGGFFNDNRLIGLECERLRGFDLSGYNDVLICRQGAGTKRQRPQLLRPTLDIPEWIPRKWFSKTVPPECDDTAFPPGSGSKEIPTLIDDTATDHKEHPRRKKRRKRKKPQNPHASLHIQKDEGLHQMSASTSLGTEEVSGDPGTSEVYRPSDGGTPDKDFFPMLEEEEF